MIVLVLAVALAVAGPADLHVERAWVALEEQRSQDARSHALEALDAEPSSEPAWRVYLEACVQAGLEHRGAAELVAAGATHPAATLALEQGAQLEPLWPSGRTPRSDRRRRAVVSSVVDGVGEADAAEAYRIRRRLVGGGERSPEVVMQRLVALGEPAPLSRATWSAEMRQALATAMVHLGELTIPAAATPVEGAEIARRAALLLQEAGRLEEADAAWQLARDLEDSAASAAHHAGVLHRLGRRDDAAALAHEVAHLAVRPTWDDLGLARYERQSQALARAIELTGRDRDTLYEAAIDHPDDLALLSEALLLDPDTPSAWMARRAALLEARGHPDAAFEAWAVAVAEGAATPDTLERTWTGAGDWEDGAAAAVAAWVQWRSSSIEPQSRPRVARSGELVPEWSLVVDGARVGRGELDGRVVVLAFWASWCAPCMDELPELAELARDLRAEGAPVTIVAVSIDDTHRPYARTLSRLDVDGLAVGRAPELRARFGISSLPASWIIGPDGEAAALHVGYKRGQRARLEHEIRSLLP